MYIDGDVKSEIFQDKKFEIKMNAKGTRAEAKTVLQEVYDRLRLKSARFSRVSGEYRRGILAFGPLEKSL